jgi:uncharacterized protein (UPF0297 family)
MYIVNEDSMNKSLLAKVYQKLQESGRASLRKNVGFQIKVDEEMIYKQGENGTMIRNFEIFVRIGEILISKLEKSYEDFEAFQRKMDTALRPLNLTAPKLNDREQNFGAFQSDYDQFFRDSDYGLNKVTVEEQFRSIKEFCREISINSEFYIKEFYEFFEIPERYQKEADLARSKLLSIGSAVRPSDLRQTVKTIIDSNKKNLRSSTGEQIKWIEYDKERTQKYSVYFQVYCEDVKKHSPEDKFYSYIFRIQSVLSPELNYSVVKRYSEFVKLLENLKRTVVCKPPPLPNKSYFGMSEDSLEKRKNGLTEWLLLTLNEKMYHCKFLFSFIELPFAKFNSHMTFRPIEKLYDEYEFDLRVSDFTTVTNEDLDNTFTLYSISVSVMNRNMKNLVSCFVVYRRYKEFYNLHKTLKKKFYKYKEVLPDIPPKVAFKKLESRQFQFEDFLQKIVKFTDIFDSIDFRKFLMLNPMKFNEFNVQKIQF